MFESLTFSSDASWIPVADAIAKASLLFGAAGLVSFVLRRRSAAARHMIWTLALVGVLVLPVLSIALPRWQLPILTLKADIAPLAASNYQLPTPSSRLPVASSQLSVGPVLTGNWEPGTGNFG